MPFLNKKKKKIKEDRFFFPSQDKEILDSYPTKDVGIAMLSQ